jgi:hypothetical protein
MTGVTASSSVLQGKFTSLHEKCPLAALHNNMLEYNLPGKRNNRLKPYRLV